MAYTQLSPTATPGGRYSFSAKAKAVNKGTGPFTELSVLATPGKIHSFAGKVFAGKGEGRFTELSVMALPGGIHSFTAKTSATVTVTAEDVESVRSSKEWRGRQVRHIFREDQELLEIIQMMVGSGMLN